MRQNTATFLKLSTIEVVNNINADVIGLDSQESQAKQSQLTAPEPWYPRSDKQAKGGAPWQVVGMPPPLEAVSANNEVIRS